MKPSETLFTCAECGGKVRMTARGGRTREYRRGVFLDIPEDFEIPTCARCGEEYMSQEISSSLDELLAKDFIARQKREWRMGVDLLRNLHGVTQGEIEDACGVTRSYLSHLLAGRKEAGETLGRLMRVFVHIPEAFEYARQGCPWQLDASVWLSVSLSVSRVEHFERATTQDFEKKYVRVAPRARAVYQQASTAANDGHYGNDIDYAARLAQ